MEMIKKSSANRNEKKKVVKGTSRISVYDIELSYSLNC